MSLCDAAPLGAPEGGVLGARSIPVLLEALLAARPASRISLPGSLREDWEGRVLASGARCRVLHLEGREVLATLMDAVADCGPEEQVWLNLDRSPALDETDLLTVDAFLAFAATREHPPLVVLLRDDAAGLVRTGRLLVDRQRNALLLRDSHEGAYALGMPDLLAGLARHGAGGVPVPPTFLKPGVPGGHLLALDVDGVLIDPGRSFQEAVAAALRELAPGLAWSDDHFAAFKRVGGFNNDFRLAAGALALGERGALGTLDQAVGRGFPHLEARIAELEPLCQATVQKHYARTQRLERPLVGREDLDAFPGDLAIFTGRPPEELLMAYGVLGFRLPAVADGAPHLRKPRPEGLIQLADAFRASRVTFVGDTCDDASALRGARALCPGVEWVFAAVGPDRDRIAREGDLRAEGLRELLARIGAP